MHTRPIVVYPEDVPIYIGIGVLYLSELWPRVSACQTPVISWQHTAQQRHLLPAPATQNEIFNT